MSNRSKPFSIIALFCITTTILLWLPFLLNLESFWGIQLSGNFDIIKRNYDGLNYVIIAKSFYQPDIISTFPQTLPASYFAAHFPGFPFFIYALGSIIGFLNAMILLPVIFSIFAAWVFYLLLEELGIREDKIWLACVFLILPARWLIVRSVGSPEPLFITFLLLSMLFFCKALNEKKIRHFLLASIFGAMAVLVRSPGVLLFGAYGLSILWYTWQKTTKEKVSLVSAFPFGSLWLILIPLTLVGIFGWYAIAYKDFFAYFNSGDNIHLLFPPFQIFNTQQPWVGSIWLEDIVFYYVIYLTATFILWKKQLYPLFWFALVYLLAIVSVAHRDVARYSLPLAPFAIIAFSSFLTKPEFKIAIALLFLAIYLYALNFINTNTFPVSTLAPYL